MDFTATYILSKTQDTIKVGFGEEGRYLYTDSKKVAEAMKGALKQFGAADHSDGLLKLLIDLENIEMLMHFKFGKNTIIGNIDLTNFFPKKENGETDKLIAKKTSEEIIILEKSYALHAVYPNQKQEETLTVAFDNDHAVNYNKHFRKIMGMATGNIIDIDVPNGLLVYARDSKENEIIRLLAIDERPKKGLLNLDLTFQELKQ